MDTAAKSWSCSEKRGEARSGPKGSFLRFSRCSSRKKCRLQCLQCEKECEVEVVKFRFFLFFFFFFFFGKENFLGKWGPFRVMLRVFNFYHKKVCCWRKTITLRVDVGSGSFSRCNCRKKALAAEVLAIWEGMRGHAVSVDLFFSFLLEKRTFSAQEDVFDQCCMFFFCVFCRWRKTSAILKEEVPWEPVCGCEQNMM